MRSAQHHPLEVIERARSVFQVSRVLVGVSCGKDSIATLALCHKYFAEVQAYFMYLVPNLEFQESYLRYIERRFNLSIIRMPHWMMATMYKENVLRHPTKQARELKKVRPRDVDAYLRQRTGITWIATGEKCCDSLERNAMIKQTQAISLKRHRLWPIAHWSHASVFNYLKSERIALPPEYREKDYASSFGSLWYRDLAPIKENYPADWERVKAFFPLIESQMLRYRLKAEREQANAAERQEVSIGNTEGNGSS